LASIRLLQSCRFHHEGIARQYLKIAGKWEDHLLFAKLSGDE
jgi:ribosomal-protein-alanine N-acetyltransferase